MRALLVAFGSIVALAVPVRAEPRIASGLLCNYSLDHGPNDESAYAEIDGGPLVALEPGADISMTCTLQAGPGSETHDGPDGAVVSSSATPQVTAIPPTIVPFVADVFRDGVAMCTEVTVGGTTYYYDFRFDGTAAGWSTDPGAGCDVYICACVGPSGLNVVRELDPEVCAELREHTTVVPFAKIEPEGDVWVRGGLVWDCPPYE